MVRRAGRGPDDNPGPETKDFVTHLQREHGVRFLDQSGIRWIVHIKWAYVITGQAFLKRAVMLNLHINLTGFRIT